VDGRDEHRISLQGYLPSPTLETFIRIATAISFLSLVTFRGFPSLTTPDRRL
jgi:hypothetical protein